MKETLRNIFKIPFVRNVLIITTGTAGAQIITMFASPFITRIYGPDMMGVMGTFTSLTRILIPIAALTYPIAIVLPSKSEDAKGIARLSLIITAMISTLSFLVIILFNKNLVDIFNLTEIKSYIYLIPLVVLLAGIIQVMEQWFIRTKQFSISAKATFYQSLIVNSGKLGIGLIYPIASTLVVITAVGDGIKAFIMFFLTKEKKQTHNEKKNKNKNSTKDLAKKYNDFPLYRAPQEFFNAMSDGVPTLMLASLFGSVSAGFYTIGRTVLRIPVQLVGKSVGDVFYPHIAEAANEGKDVSALLKRATITLGIIGIIPFGIIILFGPTIFNVVFGSEWNMAGEYARWIALWSYTSLLNRPSVRSLPVLHAQRFHLIYTIIMLITRILALVLGFVIFHSDIVAISFFAVIGALLNIGLVIFAIKLAKTKGNI